MRFRLTFSILWCWATAIWTTISSSLIHSLNRWKPNRGKLLHQWHRSWTIYFFQYCERVVWTRKGKWDLAPALAPAHFSTVSKRPLHPQLIPLPLKLMSADRETTCPPQNKELAKTLNTSWVWWQFCISARFIPCWNPSFSSCASKNSGYGRDPLESKPTKSGVVYSGVVMSHTLRWWTKSE